jgi:di/tricarboxylate transporter
MTPDTFQILIVLGLLVTAIVLFARETFPIDVTTLLMLAGLVISGVLTPQEAFAGFSSEIIITLGSIFALTGALQQTGVVDFLGRRLREIAKVNALLLLIVLMIATGFLSGFINNTTATALFIAPTIGAARHLRISPSKLLMPIAFASILGGTCTLIGTSTNLATNAFLISEVYKGFQLFEFTKLGVVLFGVGLVYLVTVGWKLLPNHPPEEFDSAAAVREFLSEIVVTPGSHLIGQSVFDGGLGKFGFQILALFRSKVQIEITDQTRIEAGDVMLVSGSSEELMKVKAAAGIEIRPDLKHAQEDIEKAGVHVAEVFVNARSELIGQTLKQARFRQRFGLTVLAIDRQGETLRDRLSNIPLEIGDLLLVQGTRAAVDGLRQRRALTVLEELNPALYRRKRGLFVVAAFATAIVLGGMGILPLAVGLLIAAVLSVVARALTMQEAYQFIEWRMLVLIGGMTAFGVAMTKTGAADVLSGHIATLFSPLGITGLLGAYFVLTVILTQPLSNAAAALVVLPIALNAAQDVGADPRTFAITVMMGASVGLITPFEPSCLLVYGPGKYRFSDYVKVGGGLTVLLGIVCLWLIPKFWPPGVP